MRIRGYGRGLDRQLINRLESIATTGLEPDLTAWLMVPVEVSLQRRHGEKEDRIEAEGRAFLRRVADGFAVLAEQRNWSQIDAQQSVSKLSQVLEQTLRETLQ